MLTTTSKSKFDQYPYFIEEKTEAQKGLIIYTRLNYVKWRSSIHIRMPDTTDHIL